MKLYCEKLEKGLYFVKLHGIEYVFLPKGKTRNDENYYTYGVRLEAKSKKDALEKMTLCLTSGEYSIIHDDLWAWR